MKRAVIVACTLVACSGSETEPPIVVDAGMGTPDAGHRDAGPSSPCGDGFCDESIGESWSTCAADCPLEGPDGLEGYRCTMAWGAPPAFDCDEGLVCLAWDVLSTRDDLTGPLKSCVRPCTLDSECGADRRCVEAHRLAKAGDVDRYCVDDVAEPGGICGGSRLGTSRLPGVVVETGRRMVGCETPAECFSALPNVHIDEGICIHRCGRADDAPCPSSHPYCNPRAFEVDGSTVTVGACSVARLDVGAWCERDNGLVHQLIDRCDTSTNAPARLDCIRFGLDRGVCLQRCDDGAVCDAPTTCVVDGTKDGEDLCVESCSAFPDDCDGEGGRGNGRFCHALTSSVSTCLDRRSPLLANGAIDSAGQTVGQGDDCSAEPTGFAQCPEPTACVALPEGASCLIGCSVGDEDYCAEQTARLGVGTVNATCTAILQASAIGVCGGDAE